MIILVFIVHQLGKKNILKAVSMISFLCAIFVIIVMWIMLFL